MMHCDKCGDEISEDFANHYRLFHPDIDVDKDASLLVWPDGISVLINEQNPDFGG
jgi:hypothetical protein